MREQLETRLAELEREFSAGEQKLREIEGQQTRLRDTLLRIDGAMHVLRELLAKTDAMEQSPGKADDTVAMSDGNGSGAPGGVHPARLSRSARGGAVA
jgi:uncharacterized coiled-coil protein SlyX